MIFPLNGYIQVKQPEKEEETTASGIYIPDASKKKQRPTSAEVIATDPHTEGMHVVVGDTVFFQDFSMLTFKDGEDELYFVKFAEVIATKK